MNYLIQIQRFRFVWPIKFTIAYKSRSIIETKNYRLYTYYNQRKKLQNHEQKKYIFQSIFFKTKITRYKTTFYFDFAIGEQTNIYCTKKMKFSTREENHKFLPKK